jgi:hypothetical protein
MGEMRRAKKKEAAIGGEWAARLDICVQLTESADKVAPTTAGYAAPVGYGLGSEEGLLAQLCAGGLDPPPYAPAVNAHAPFSAYGPQGALRVDDLPGVAAAAGGGLSMYFAISSLENARCSVAGGRACYFGVLKIGPGVPDAKSRATPWEAGPIPLSLQSTVRIPTASSFVKHLRDNFAVVEVYEEVPPAPSPSPALLLGDSSEEDSWVAAWLLITLESRWQVHVCTF